VENTIANGRRSKLAVKMNSQEAKQEMDESRFPASNDSSKTPENIQQFPPGALGIRPPL
jgi:hypothetical protein